METDLTVALLLVISIAHITGRSKVVAAGSAMALLARPDTAILVIPVWLDMVQRERRIPWREGALTLSLIAPWLIFGTLAFGSPLTASMAAKSVTYRLPPEAALVRLIQHYSTPFFENALFGPRWQLGGFALYLLLCILGGVRIIRDNRRTWPLIAYPYLYLVVFSAANPLLFRWYLSPPLPFYFLSILCGVWMLSSDLPQGFLKSRVRPQESSAIPSIALALFAVGAIVLTANAWDLQPDHGPNRIAPNMAWFKLELLYDHAAEIVSSSAAPGDRLCAGDIGVLGYRTGLEILDTVGLVTPESWSHYPADPDLYIINYAIPAELVLALDPDYVVILEVYGRKGLVPDPRFQARYRLLRKLETDIYGSDGMLIYSRL
jgi:hypothetical protein